MVARRSGDAAAHVSAIPVSDDGLQIRSICVMIPQDPNRMKTAPPHQGFVPEPGIAARIRLRGGQDMDIADSCVFVTGATSGFGRATARRFAEAGARVVATGRRADRLAALAGELGERVLALPLDVADRVAVAAAFAGLPAAFAEVSVLINNAGLALDRGPAYQASLDEWETMIDVNVKGVVYCTHAVLPGMVERDLGHIVNIGSVAGSSSNPGSCVYGSTKAFVHRFSENLRADLLGHNVRVTIISPGAAETEFMLVRQKGDTEKAAAHYEGLGALSADDVAQAIVDAVTRPDHVNVTHVELTPVMQAAGPRAFHRHRK